MICIARDKKEVPIQDEEFSRTPEGLASWLVNMYRQEISALEKSASGLRQELWFGLDPLFAEELQGSLASFLRGMWGCAYFDKIFEVYTEEDINKKTTLYRVYLQRK